MKHSFIPIALCCLLLPLTACQSGAESPLGQYREALAAGMEAEGDPHTLFLGLQLPMSKPAFYDHCTELNRQQLITMGGGVNKVAHTLATELDRPAQMTFQPVFNASNPPMTDSYELTFIYQDWAPWNKAAAPERLLPDAADYLGQQLQLTLEPLAHPVHDTIYVGIEENLLVALWTDLSDVRGSIVDLSGLEKDPLGLVE